MNSVIIMEACLRTMYTTSTSTDVLLNLHFYSVLASFSCCLTPKLLIKVTFQHIKLHLLVAEKEKHLWKYT